MTAVLIWASLAVAAEGYNPFTGQKTGAQKPQKKTPVKESSTPAPVKTPPLPMPAPIPVYPNQQHIQQPGGMPSNAPQEKQTSYRVVGKIDDKVSIADPYGAIFLVNDGDTIDGCVIDYPTVNCNPTSGKFKKSKSQAAKPSATAKADPDEDLDLEFEDDVEKPASKKAPAPAPTVSDEPPAWFKQNLTRSYVDKDLGLIEVMLEGQDIVAIKISASRAETAEKALQKYIRVKEIKDKSVYYSLSGLVSKGEI